MFGANTVMPGRHHRLVLRVEGRSLLGLRAAVQAEHRRARPDPTARPVQPAGQRQAVPAEEELQRRHHQVGGRQGRHVGRAGPGHAGDVEAPQLARSPRSLDADQRGRPVPTEQRAADHQPVQVGHRTRDPGEGVQQLDLAAAAGGVPDQQQPPSGIVGVQSLELGVLPGAPARRTRPPNRRARSASPPTGGAAGPRRWPGTRPSARRRPRGEGRMIARSVEPRSG